MFTAILHALMSRIAGHAPGAHATGAAVEPASHGALENVGAEHLTHAQNLGAGINEATSAVATVAMMEVAASGIGKSPGITRS